MHVLEAKFNGSYNYVGVTVTTPDGVKTCRAIISVCTVDLPARALVCNMKAFNGAYSCVTCLDEGDNTIGASPMVRYWPYNASCQVRSTTDVIDAFTDATTTNTAVSITPTCHLVHLIRFVGTKVFLYCHYISHFIW